MVEMECDPREGLDDSESDDDDEVSNCSQAPTLVRARRKAMRQYCWPPGRLRSAAGRQVCAVCDSGTQAGAASQLERPAVPVYLALVDVCCGEDTLELTRSALQAALEALPPAARFGLITYSQRVRCSGGCPPAGRSRTHECCARRQCSAHELGSCQLPVRHVLSLLRSSTATTWQVCS
jgi:Sec23/Sec24 trunk domain